MLNRNPPHLLEKIQVAIGFLMDGGMDPATPSRSNFLANQISISEILPWDRKSYLTNAILPMTSSNFYHVKLHLSVFRDFWRLNLKYINKNSDEQEKESIFSCDGIKRLSAYCKGGNFNIHFWAWFGYFIC